MSHVKGSKINISPFHSYYPPSPPRFFFRIPRLDNFKTRKNFRKIFDLVVYPLPPVFHEHDRQGGTEEEWKGLISRSLVEILEESE